MSALNEDDHQQRLIFLLGMGLAAIGLWQTHFGNLLLYPFTILASWFHEMGHGLAAMLVGYSFQRLLIFPDGSGLAMSLQPYDSARWTVALIAASGPLGPALAGAGLIASSRTERATRTALGILGWFLLLSTLVWVRSLTGWIVLPLIGIAVLALLRRGTPPQQRLGLQTLGVLACASAWRQFDYLFSPGARIGGRMQRSDTGAIADALLLPYWIWGAVISVAILALIWWAFWAAWKR